MTAKTHLLASLEAASELCWLHLQAELDRRLALQPRVSLGLSGGSTPLGLFRHMASSAAHPRWPRTDCFWVDERCVPPDHEENNFHQAMRLLAPLPAAFHRIDTSLPPAAAALAYDRLLDGYLVSQGLQGLDIALLGMGTDGHYASVFPGTAALYYQGGRKALENHVPQLNGWRITLTPPFLQRSRCRFLLAGGSRKQAVLTAIKENPGRFPAGQLLPCREGDQWFIYEETT